MQSARVRHNTPTRRCWSAPGWRRNPVPQCSIDGLKHLRIHVRRDHRPPLGVRALKQRHERCSATLAQRFTIRLPAANLHRQPFTVLGDPGQVDAGGATCIAIKHPARTWSNISKTTSRSGGGEPSGGGRESNAVVRPKIHGHSRA